MNVLVTGGTGFIGANLVARLVQRGEHVRVLRRASSSLAALEGMDVEYIIGDILDAASIARAVEGCEVVYHVAAIATYWQSTPEQLYRANVEGTRLVMEACLQARVPRVVHTSSISAIGIPANGAPGNEETRFDARSARFAYANSKHRAEIQVLRLVEQGLPAVIVNPGIVVGVREYAMHIGSILKQFKQGHVLAVPPGRVCLCDVDAVVEGEIGAAERGRIGERYILGGENLTLHEIAAIVGEIMGRPAPRIILPRWSLEPIALAIDLYNRFNGQPAILNGEQIRLSGYIHSFDSSKAVRELGYPLLSFRGAVEKAYRWYVEKGFM